MKKSSFCIIILIFLFAWLVSGCSNQGLWQDELNSASKENKYTILYIDDSSSNNSTAIKDSFKENVNTMKDQFRFIEVDYKTEQENLLKYLKTSSVNTFPLIISIAPNGAITRTFTQKFTNDEIKASVVTNKESDILLSLQDGKITLLCTYKGEPSDIDRVKSELKDIEKNFKAFVDIYYLNSEDTDDKPFFEKLPEISTDITVFITVPPGSITAKLEGAQINTNNLLKAIQSSCSTGSCGPSGCG